MATKIGLGEITDLNLNNFGMLTGGAKPGSPTYENALARLVEKGGDDLKGVTDPIERISSSVSRFIEENGMTETMQAEHTRMTEALKDGRELSPFNREMHRSRDFGLTMREASLAAPPVSAAPSMADLKAAGVKVPEAIPPTSTADLSPEKMSFIETLKAEKAATEETARKAIPATRQSIEESGYLYHYAPREARESIVSGGFDVSKARTAVSDIAGAGSEFATHVPDNSMYFYTNPNDAPSAGTIFGTGETGQRPDLYRVKVEPGMLDDMAVDPRLPVRGGVGSAVIVPSKTGKFQAELIGENAQFGIRGENISPATHDPIRSTSATSKIKPNFKYYNDPNYNPDIFFGDNEHTVRAFHPDTGEQMGRLSFYGKDAITPGEIDKIEVTEKFRRQGVATGLLEEARRLSAVDENVPYVVHSKSRTPDGDAWAKSTGDALPEKIGSSDDLIEPSVVRKVEDPTREAYDAARAKGELIVTEPVTPKPPPSVPASIDKDAALRTYLEEVGKEKELEAGRSTWDKKHVDFGDLHDQAFRNTANSLGLSDHVLMDSLRSNDLYQEHLALETWRDNRRWGQSPLRGDAHTGMTFDEVESRVQKNLTNFMKGTAVAPQAPSVAPTSPQSAVATETYDHGAGVSKSTASGDVLSEPPPPKPTRTGPGEIGKPADVRTRPSSRGADAASTTTGSTPKPPPTTGSVAMDPPKVPTTPPSSGAPSKMRGLMDDGLEAAKNVAARNPMGIRAAAVAGLLGVGAVVAGRRGQPRSDQRNTYLEESRRKMQG
jgi:hypothetical protein